MTTEQAEQSVGHRVFINGNVLTVDGTNSVAEAVSIKAGRIEAVGTTEEIKKGIDESTEVVDLEGKTLIPGFIETHGHFPASGFHALGVNLNSPPIGPMKTIADVIKGLKEKAATLEKGKWLIGLGYDDTLLAEKRHITRDELDDVSTDHPIYLAHISGHISYANSKALETMNYTEDTPDPEGGVICRDKDTGRLTGVLEEEAGFAMQAQAINMPPEEMLAMVQYSVKDYASAGVTTVQSGLASEEMLNGLSMASQFEQVPLRVMAWPDIDLTNKILDGSYDTKAHTSEIFQIGAAKIIGDGSIQGYTAYLSEPYHVPYKGDTEYRGYPVTDRETMVKWVKKFHKAGLQIAIHGNGDAAIDNIIYAVNEAQKEHPREDHRHIIIHCQTVRDDQLEEIKRLGLTPSFFPVHQYYWGDRHMAIFLGPERASRQNPCRTALDMGIPITIHLDTPVTPINKLLLMWAAVNRISTGGNVIGEKERISALEALRAVTIDGAWQIFQEENRGSIEVGKYADLAILSADPLADPAGIKDMEVLETIVGGNTVYQKQS